nr:hypothetical protein [Phascolarctobacterium succinatutens]
MSKNLLPEIAKMLDVEMYEKFKIEGVSSDLVFRIGVDGLEMERFDYAEDDRIWVTLASCNFVDLLTGKAKIVKLPWKPDYRQMYWTFGLKDGIWVVVPREWEDYPAEILLADKGWTYRTKEEAEDALPKVAAEIGVQYVL